MSQQTPYSISTPTAQSPRRVPVPEKSLPVTTQSVQDQNATAPLLTSTPSSRALTSSSAPTQQTSSKHGSRSLSVLGQNFWLWELVSIIFSILSLLALIIVLARYNNKPLEPGTFGITLNAIISILVSLSEFTLVYPVAEALNQQRWISLRTSHKPRPLTSVQTFDEASRGPLGAVKLLGQSSVINPASILGASMMIMHLFMGPFAQQLVTYPQRPTPVAESTAGRPYLSRAQSYQLNVITRDKSYTDFFQAATAGLENTIYHNASTSNFHCRSGNCTFNPFTSLGVCSTCYDVSSMVTTSCDANQTSEFSIKKPCNVTLPGGFFTTNKQSSFTYASVTNGLFGGISDEYGQLNASFTWNETFAPYFGDVMYPIFATMVHDETTEREDSTYNMCALSYCLQTYFNVSVQSGTLNNGRTENMIPLGPLQGSPIPKNGWELRPNETYAKYSQNQTYVLGATTPPSIQILLASIFSVECPQINAVNSTTCGAPYFTNALDQSWLRSNATSPQMLENFAQSVTNSFRNNGGFDHGNNNNDADNFAYGTESELLVYVHIEWGWLAMPCAVVLFSTVFVLWTIAQTSAHKNQIWKSSALALMYHGLVDVPDPAPETLFDMQKSAKECYVLLEPTTATGSLRMRNT